MKELKDNYPPKWFRILVPAFAIYLLGLIVYGIILCNRVYTMDMFP